MSDTVGFVTDSFLNGSARFATVLFKRPENRVHSSARYPMGVVANMLRVHPGRREPNGALRGRFISPLCVSFFLVMALLVAYAQAAAGCSQVSAGETLRVRLLQPVSSYSSKQGTSVRAILIESPQCDGLPIFPVGTVVEGTVKSVQRVGLGFRHETASLEIEFRRILPEDGASLPLRARVLDVDNARETVRKGVIHGVRITQTPQGLFTLRIIHLPTWDPDGLWILAARRAIFPVFPEPEIYFPSGTDLRLELAEPLNVASEVAAAPINADFPMADEDRLDELMRSLPSRTFTPKNQDTDVVNLAFVGSKQQLEAAFQAAGWTAGDPISKRAVLRQFLAVLSVRNYSRLPMEKQWMDGKANDLALQKGLDSYDKRDHLRIWSEPLTWQGQPIWISSSTHDNAATLSLRKGFIHRVDNDIDDERSKIVRDLTLAGCVDAVHLTTRPEMPNFMENATGDALRTDKAISVVQLRDCAPQVSTESAATFVLPSRPPSKIARYVRTQVLSFRSDLWRSNLIYTTVELGRAGFHAIRRNRTSARLY